MKSGIRIALAAVSIGLIWCVFLPWLGEQTVVKRHVDRLHAADINASAMYYTELECQQWLRR